MGCGRVDERTDEQSTGGLCGCVDAQIHAKVGHCACLGCIRLTKHGMAWQGGAEQSRVEQGRAEQDKGAKCESRNGFSLPGCRRWAENVLVVHSAPLSSATANGKHPHGQAGSQEGQAQTRKVSVLALRSGGRLRSLQYIRPYSVYSALRGRNGKGRAAAGRGCVGDGEVIQPWEAGTNAASPRQQACSQAAGTEQELLGTCLTHPLAAQCRGTRCTGSVSRHKSSGPRPTPGVRCC